MKDELTTTHKLVHDIMAVDERARSDDKWLCYCVIDAICNAHGKKMFIPFELFKEFPSYETITRVRRRIQNDRKELLPNTSTQARRNEWESTMNSYAAIP